MRLPPAGSTRRPGRYRTGTPHACACACAHQVGAIRHHPLPGESPSIVARRTLICTARAAAFCFDPHPHPASAVHCRYPGAPFPSGIPFLTTSVKWAPFPSKRRDHVDRTCTRAQPQPFIPLHAPYRPEFQNPGSPGTTTTSTTEISEPLLLLQFPHVHAQGAPLGGCVFDLQPRVHYRRARAHWPPTARSGRGGRRAVNSSKNSGRPAGRHVT
jgi:hypothetical protein